MSLPPDTPSDTPDTPPALPATQPSADALAEWQSLLVQAHYQQSPLAILSGMVISALMSAVLWSSVPRPLVLLWLVSVEVLMGLRLPPKKKPGMFSSPEPSVYVLSSTSLVLLRGKGGMAQNAGMPRSSGLGLKQRLMVRDPDMPSISA